MVGAAAADGVAAAAVPHGAVVRDLLVLKGFFLRRAEEASGTERAAAVTSLAAVGGLLARLGDKGAPPALAMPGGAKAPAREAAALRRGHDRLARLAQLRTELAARRIDLTDALRDAQRSVDGTAKEVAALKHFVEHHIKAATARTVHIKTGS